MKVKELLKQLEFSNPESEMVLNTVCSETNRKIYYKIDKVNQYNDNEGLILIEFLKTIKSF